MATVKKAHTSKTATTETQLTVETNEVKAFLSNRAITGYKNFLEEQFDGAPSFIDAIQSGITYQGVTEITFSDLETALLDTGSEFEQEAVNPSIVKKLVASLISESQQFNLVTVTSFNDIMYVTGGRHRSTALLYVAYEVLGLSSDDTLFVNLQSVDDYDLLTKLIISDNASRVMRPAERGVLDLIGRGTNSEDSVSSQLKTVFSSDFTKSEMKRAIASIAVRMNRHEGYNLKAQTVQVIFQAIASHLLEREHNAGVFQAILTDSLNYLVKHYNLLLQKYTNVARAYSEVAEYILETTGSNVKLDKLRTMVEVKEVEAVEKEEAKLVKMEAQEAKRVAREQMSIAREKANLAADKIIAAKAKTKAQAVQGVAKVATKKVAPPIVEEVEEDEYEVIDLDDDTEVEEVAPVTTRKTASRKATPLRAL